MGEMYRVDGVEVFSEGEWNGDAYSMQDLEGMVSAFEEHKQGMRPFLKLGHDKNQKLLQKDGMPAAGWIDRLYIKGNKLLADFVDIPKKVKDLIDRRAYRKVSSEIYCGVKVGDKTYPYMLGAVALLGADTPGVSNLSDILSMYSAAGFKEIKGYAASDEFESRTYEFAASNKKETKMEKSEAEIKLETQLEQADKEKKDLEAKVKEFGLKQDEADKELEALREFKKASEEEKQKLLQEKQDAERETFLQGLISEKLCTPSMKQFAKALIGPELKEYSFKVGSEEKKMDKQQALKEMLKLFAAAKDVNFDESSDQGEQKENLEKKVQDYMEKNKVSYSIAAKAILSENKGE